MSAMTSPGTTSVISSSGAPISWANAATGMAWPSASRGTIAIRPDRITYIPGTASPAWKRSFPAANRLTSPKRRTWSISVSERTGNIWWNRDARAALDAAPAGVPFPDASCPLRSSSIGTSVPTAGELIQYHTIPIHAMRVWHRSQGRGGERRVQWTEWGRCADRYIRAEEAPLHCEGLYVPTIADGRKRQRTTVIGRLRLTRFRQCKMAVTD